MSSLYVRTQIKTFLSTNMPTAKFVDLTGEFEDLNKVLIRNGVGLTDPWIGIQFIGSEEVPVTVTNDNTAGKFRETGAVYLHLVERARLGVADLILATAETVANLLRARRINDIIITRFTPPSFEAGATLEFEGGYISASIILSYQRDLNI